MQCFRCGAFISGDFACPSCGSALEIGQDVCPSCGSPVLCAQCAEGVSGAGVAQPSASGSDGGRQLESVGLQYEYSSVQIPLYLSRDENETPSHFQQRFHNQIMQRIGSAALEGWETVDPLEYSLLQREGLISGGMLGLLGRHVVTIRLKRLVGGPQDPSQADTKENLQPPL